MNGLWGLNKTVLTIENGRFKLKQFNGAELDGPLFDQKDRPV